MVHPEITQFKTRQFRVSVELNKFIATCEAIHSNIVRDLVISCFGRVLIHTPITLMGLNRELHFSCGSEAQRSKFGFSVAPPEVWGRWGEQIKKTASSEKVHGGMMRVQMREQPRPDDYAGYIQAEIQPSLLIRGGAGIFIQINNHFEITQDQEHPAQGAVETLEGAWELSLLKAEEIIGEVMLKATRTD